MCGNYSTAADRRQPLCLATKRHLLVGGEIEGHNSPPQFSRFPAVEVR